MNPPVDVHTPEIRGGFSPGYAYQLGEGSSPGVGRSRLSTQGGLSPGYAHQLGFISGRLQFWGLIARGVISGIRLIDWLIHDAHGRYLVNRRYVVDIQYKIITYLESQTPRFLLSIQRYRVTSRIRGRLLRNNTIAKHFQAENSVLFQVHLCPIFPSPLV